MRDEKFLVTAKKRQRPQVQMRAVFVALISKFQSVITAERPNTFRREIYLRSLNGVDKIRLAILLKIHRGAEMDPRNGKSSRERETASFCSRFNTDPPRLEAEGRLKSNSLQEILLKSMPFWAEPQSDECHFLSLKLSSICCALMNSIVPRPIRCCRCWSN